MPNPVGAGARDKLVTIEQLSESNGASGFPVETWSPLVQVWASCAEPTGREAFKADQLSASADMRWEVPYRADLDPELVDVPKTRRIVYYTRVYDITSAYQVRRQTTVAVLTLSRSK